MMVYSPWSDFLDPRHFDEAPAFLDSYIEAGVACQEWEFYGTYQKVETLPEERYYMTFDPHKLEGEINYNKSYRSNEHYMVGARYRGPFTPLRPVLGVGVNLVQLIWTKEEKLTRVYYETETDSFGFTYYDEIYSYTWHERKDDWKSAWNVGGEFEIGIGYSFTSHFEILAVTQVPYAFANFGDDWLGNNIWDRDVISPAFQMQLRYSPFTLKL